MLDKIRQIAAEKGQTVDQAAAACGVSRSQLWRIARRDSPGSIEFWDAMIGWSGGRITPDTRFAAAIEGARRAAIGGSPK